MSPDEAWVVGVDASTTGVKALIVDARGVVRATGRASYPLDRLGGGGFEQDARHWLAATVEAVRTAVAELAAPERHRIAALCIAHQRESFVVTDASGDPLAPALVWMDARCAPEVASAAAELAPERAHRLSGKVASTTPSLYKLRYFFERLRPDLASREKRVLDVHAYLVWQLTGELLTSLASADPLGLVDLEQRAWSPELCAAARVHVRELPRLVEPGSIVGPLRDGLADSLGLPRGVSVVAGAGDGQAAGLGMGVFEPTQCYINLGTALVAGRPSVDSHFDRAFRTLYGADGAGYLLETDLLGGTLTLDWLVDVLLSDASADGSLQGGAARTSRLAGLESLASALPPGSEGLVALPYWCGVMNPHWDDAASGALLGLRVDHGPAHVYRAILEGLALELRLQLEAVEAVVGRAEELRVTGGGAQRELFAQIVADVLGRELHHVEAPEATALGAALLAHAAIEPGCDTRELARRWSGPSRVRRPSPGALAYDRLYREVYAGLYASLASRLASLSSFRSSFSQARRASA